MEYVIGPILALLISMKFTKWSTAKTVETAKNNRERLELVEAKVMELDTVVLPKVVQTVGPVAKAVVRINEQLGIWLYNR